MKRGKHLTSPGVPVLRVLALVLALALALPALAERTPPADVDLLMATNAVAAFGINISDMVNSSKGEYAYTMIDVDSDITPDFVEKLSAIDGVIRVRLIKKKKKTYH